MNNLVKISAAEYGLEEKKAQQISDMFKPMLDKMVDLEKEYNEFALLEISEDTCKKAKELRSKFVKVRTGTAKIHKELKTFYLQGGRFVDGWKNAQIMASGDIEKKLKDIEEHYLNIEKEKIAKLQAKREQEVLLYTDISSNSHLGEMLDCVWDNYILGLKLVHEAKIKAAEEERQKQIEEEQKRIEEDKAIREENERIKQELIEKEAEVEKERKEARKKEVEQEKEHQRLIEIERREIREKEIELKAITDKEAQKKQIEKEALEQELKKGDKEKYEDLKNDLKSITEKYSFKSEKYKSSFQKIIQMIDHIINSK